MIVYNKEKMKALQNISYDDLYIITDFDGTITKGSNNSTWASIFKNEKVSDEFIQECTKIYNYYHKYEFGNEISIEEKCKIMEEWYKNNIKTLEKFSITKEIIQNSADTTKYLPFRDGAKEFLKDMYERSIPVIIISAGVGDIIEQALINEKSNYENIYIYSNFLKYENEKIVGTKSKELIHPLNKNEIIMSDDLKAKISDRKNILLFGNNLYDIKMANNEKNVFKIGFLDENIEEKIEEYKAFYDIVCTDNSSYFDLKKTLWGHLPKTGTF